MTQFYFLLISEQFQVRETHLLQCRVQYSQPSYQTVMDQ